MVDERERPDKEVAPALVVAVARVVSQPGQEAPRAPRASLVAIVQAIGGDYTGSPNIRVCVNIHTCSVVLQLSRGKQPTEKDEGRRDASVRAAWWAAQYWGTVSSTSLASMPLHSSFSCPKVSTEDRGGTSSRAQSA